jgi:signal transduction histidine kinase
MAGEIESGEYFENPVLGRYGKERMIAWRNTILRDEKGNITGSLSSGEDITERKRAEQKLRDNQKRLKALAAELSIAEEHERRRIAMEIHDNLSQKLVMAKLNLQVLKASSSEQNIKDALDRECDIIAEIIEDTRCLTFELSNPVLYEIGLEQTVNNWMKTEIGDKAGLKYQFAPQGDKIEMDEDAKVFLFKAIRELLINVVKHAGANSVKVGIAAQNSEVVITVEDDGVGFDTSKLGLPSGTKGGFGLFNIRERLEYMGGRLEIDSAPGKGTRIIITAPVKKPESQRETAKLVPPISTL